MITKSIYSYRVIIKYGVYTRTIIRGVFLPLSLPTRSLLFALCFKPTGSGVTLGAVETNSDRRIHLIGFPSGIGNCGSGDNNPKSILILLEILVKENPEK